MFNTPNFEWFPQTNSEDYLKCYLNFNLRFALSHSSEYLSFQLKMLFYLISNSVFLELPCLQDTVRFYVWRVYCVRLAVSFQKTKFKTSIAKQCLTLLNHSRKSEWLLVVCSKIYTENKPHLVISSELFWIIQWTSVYFVNCAVYLNSKSWILSYIFCFNISIYLWWLNKLYMKQISCNGNI